jgi:RNA polymerase sigma-70 factor, ECF subfamily
VEEDDNDLMTKVAAGERAAFAELFRRYAGRVEGYLAKSLGPSAAAEVAQEVFLKVWRNAHRYDASKAAPATWLFAIARNARVDRIRHTSRPEPDPDDPMWVPSQPTAPDGVIHAQREASAVRQMVGELPDKQRQVIAMAYLQGMSLPEVAVALEVPLGTVKSRVRLAMARLREASAAPDDTPNAG